MGHIGCIECVYSGKKNGVLGCKKIYSVAWLGPSFDYSSQRQWEHCENKLL